VIGIYKITNKLNNKSYIGQSHFLEKRWEQHQKYKTSIHLNHAIHLYGSESFDFEIIRKITNGGLTQILLDFFEEFYIDAFDTTNPEKGYNLKTGGAAGRPSKETKEKISRANIGKIAWNKGRSLSEKHKAGIKRAHERGAYDNKLPLSKEAREKIGEANKGKTHPTSLETRKKLSIALRGKNKGRSMTAEQKKKMSESKKNLDPQIKRKLAKETSERFKNKPWSQARRDAEVKRKQQIKENQN